MLTHLKKPCIIVWTIAVRLLKSLLEILIWFDQGLGLLLCLPFYLVFGHPRPNAEATISWVVGHYAIQGKRWALGAEWILDRLFYVFEGFKLGHCRKNIAQHDDINWEEITSFTEYFRLPSNDDDKS